MIYYCLQAVVEVWYLPHLPLPQHLDQQVSHVCLDCYSSYLLSSPETTAGYSNKHGNNSKKISKRAVGDGTWEKAWASLSLFTLPIVLRALSFFPLPGPHPPDDTTNRQRREANINNLILFFWYTLFFYKNIFHKNIEVEICEILRIF